MLVPSGILVSITHDACDDYSKWMTLTCIVDPPPCTCFGLIAIPISTCTHGQDHKNIIENIALLIASVHFSWSYGFNRFMFCVSFQVVVVQMNGHDHPSESVHIFHVGKLRVKLQKGRSMKAKESYSTSMQVKVYIIVQIHQVRRCTMLGPE